MADSTYTQILDLQTEGTQEAVKDLNAVGDAAAQMGKDFEKAEKSAEEFADKTDRKVKAFQGGIDVAGGSVATFTGGLALLGVETDYIENIEKATFGAFAFAAGLKQTGDGVVALVENTEVMSKAQAVFNKVLNASPIFVVLGVITAVTAGVYALSQALDTQVDAQETLNEVTAAAQDAAADDLIQLRLLTKTVGDLSKSEESRAEALAQLKDTSDAFADITLENVNLQEDLAVATELATKQIMQQAKVEAAKSMLIDLEKERLDLVREIANDEFTFQELLLGNTLDQMKQLTDLNKITQEQALLTDIILENSEAQLEADGKLRRSRQKTNDSQEQTKDDLQEIATIELDILQIGQDGIDQLKQREKAYKTYVEGVKKALTDLAEFEEDLGEEREEEEEFSLSRRSQRNVEFQQYLVDNELTKQEAITSISKTGADTLMSVASGVADALGEDSKAGFKIQKGVSVAQTTISTIEGAIAAYKSLAGIPYVGPALGAAAAAGVTASGLAAVRQIQSQTFNGGGSGGGGSLNLPSGGSGASQGFLVPSTPTAADVPQPEPVQAYVIGQQITNQQALDSELKLRSTL